MPRGTALLAFVLACFASLGEAKPVLVAVELPN
jgi:hypothetical protein